MALEVDLYLRLSEDPRGLEAGVDRQRDDALEWCAKHDATVRREYVDNDISATTGKRRPAFEELLSAGSTAILTWHIDRLVRVSKDLERVIDLGINVHAVKSGHVDLSTPSGRAVARTITAWSTYEGEQKGERQRLAARQRARQGRPWWSSRPFGYEMDGSLRQDEARALRDAYEYLLTGMPLRQVVAALNGAGHRTCRGNLWASTTLKPVLVNPRNAAIRFYDGQEVGAASWPAVVEEETWRAAVRLLTAPERLTNGGFTARRHLLTGVAECGVCGSRIKVGVRGAAAGREGYKTYVCQARSCVSHRQEWTDDLVRAAVVAHLSRPEAAQVWAPEQPDLLEVRARAARQRLKLAELREDYADDVITRVEFRDMTAGVRGRLLEAERELEAAGVRSPLAGVLGAEDVGAAFAGLPLERQRMVVRVLVEQLVLLPRGRGRREMRPEDVRLVWAEGTS